jgi:2-dehydro-3-deoxyphosphogalactonate aldolase
MDRRMNARRARFTAAMTRLPLVAILRGIRPEEAAAIGLALQAAGFALIEVPLNSPQPFDSISTLRRVLDAATLVGAGTVRRASEVQRLAELNADLVVMPHADAGVIAAAKTAGLVCMPGVATPTEAFAALDAGADALKIFPAELVTASVLKAMRAVLPADLPLLPVGGVTATSLAAWRQAGASGFGLGSALYVPGLQPQDVTGRAQAFVRAWHASSARPP